MFWKKKQTDLPKTRLGPGGPIFSFVLLEGESYPIDLFLKHLADARVAGKAVSNIKWDDESLFSFDVGDENFVCIHIKVPYPDDLEGPIATTWMWPRALPIENVKQHRSFLQMTMISGEEDPVRRRLTLTASTALAAQQPGVTAVYWGETSLIIFPRLFVEMAEEINTPQSPPLLLWVDLRASQNEDGTTSLFTIGLAPLGHMEIEIPRIKMEIGELREWLLDIIRYLLENGPVLLDGQTIGMSVEQKIRIRHCSSIFGHAGQVIRLEPQPT